MLRRFKQWQQRRLIEKYAVPDAAWQAALAPYRFFDRLSAADNQRLRELVALFCAEKEFASGNDFTFTLDIQLQIAVRSGSSDLWLV